MFVNRNYTWRKAPFLRLIIPFAAGIIAQWYLTPATWILWVLLIAGFIIYSLSVLLPIALRFKLSFITGSAVHLLLFTLGAFITFQKNIRHHKNWFGKKYTAGDTVILILKEPPVEKTNSYKALAQISATIKNNVALGTNGDVIIYFKKDDLIKELGYGSRLVSSIHLQEIKNAGNPGGFDYNRYSLFQNITHQVYLKANDFTVLPGRETNTFDRFLFSIRKYVVHVFKKYIPGEKEQGLAEALLIGYKDDLDKTLVQSYTNTGVVHIIAISGLHLGLIYWLLVLILKPLSKIKKLSWLSPVIIITGLWLFSLLAGAQASVLRSAVMFTCLVIGQSMSKKTSVYNSLAASAFLLLCYNPFWLWDVGFQLSYAALLSILIFMKPVYNLFYIKNKFLDAVWKINAVSIAAQFLTVPLSIFHFHQFPNYFLLTNFIAVPLSSLIVLGEIFLCAISFVKPLAIYAGKILSWLIWLMNTYVERVEQLPFSLWDGLQVNVIQTALITVIVSGIGFWWLEKKKTGIWAALAALFLFGVFRTASFIRAEKQEMLVVYNVSKLQAIDFINGRQFMFWGDTALTSDNFERNFNLKPARILYRVNETSYLQGSHISNNIISFKGKKILILNQPIQTDTAETKIVADLLIVSGNKQNHPEKILQILSCQQVVLDGTLSQKQQASWIRVCDSLHIPNFPVSQKGAFVMNLN